MRTYSHAMTNPNNPLLVAALAAALFMISFVIVFNVLPH